MLPDLRDSAAPAPELSDDLRGALKYQADRAAFAATIRELDDSLFEFVVTVIQDEYDRRHPELEPA